MRQQGGQTEGISIAIAGNKADLEGKREVSVEMASSYAQEIGAVFIETSAKENLNVLDLFVQLGRKLPPVKAVVAGTVKPKVIDSHRKSESCC